MDKYRKMGRGSPHKYGCDFSIALRNALKRESRELKEAADYNANPENDQFLKNERVEIKNEHDWLLHVMISLIEDQCHELSDEQVEKYAKYILELYKVNLF